MTTITVTNGNDSGAGSLRAALAAASTGDTINFASTVTTVNLASSLVISKGVIIEGAQTGSSTPGVTINGGGSSSNFADFTIDAGVGATFDGLIIADGHAKGANNRGTPGSYDGYAAAGGIFDAGALSLTNSIVENDTATGGNGYSQLDAGGGGAGGSAAGGIYVAAGATLNLGTSDRFADDTATGGKGGNGGDGQGNGYIAAGGSGGAGGVTNVNDGVGSAGAKGQGPYGGAGGAPGTDGHNGMNSSGSFLGPGGGGGGGSAFAAVGGKGTINGPVVDLVTNNSDNINTVGSLRYVLANAAAGDTIAFTSNVTTIDLTSSLVIAKNVTIEGAQTGSITPGVTINGGGSSSDFADFTIDAGVTATFDGLVIADGHATGAAGHFESYDGQGAAGGIFDYGTLTLTHSVLDNDTAKGGAGYSQSDFGGGGGAGGSATGGVYVASGATLNFAASDSFNNDSATGGAGGHGGDGEGNNYIGKGGGGGAGGVSGVNGGAGTAGGKGQGPNGGAGGAAGADGQNGTYSNGSPSGPGGGGGGGNAFADTGGKGTINSLNDVVTNDSDNVNTTGSLPYELAHAKAGDSITFASSVTFIELTSSLVISKNVTIEGAQSGGSTPGVTISGGGSVTDFTIDVGVSATIDGLNIQGGRGTGASGSYGAPGGGTGGSGHGAAGGIYDAGTLTLTNTYFNDDRAIGGAGGTGGLYDGGGGAGGNAAGAIYVASTGRLYGSASDSFLNNSAVGGAGGRGGTTNYDGYTIGGGSGGAGGHSGINGGAGQPGQAGFDTYAPPWVAAGAGGAPGEPGGAGTPGGGGGGGTAFANVGGDGIITGVPCYCPGTRIRTARGEKRVENLKIGDEVMTASGALRPIKWIGRRSYSGRFIGGDKDIMPICIHAGALDDNVPKRNLWVSPHHAMYLNGVLIEAKDLINGVSIVQAQQVETVEYFHVELDSHDVIIAEGALAESYIDDDNRGMFHNAPAYYARYRDIAASPVRYCAPRLEDGYEVERARQRIAVRAGLLRAADPPLWGHLDIATASRVEARRSFDGAAFARTVSNVKAG